VVDAN